MLFDTRRLELLFFAEGQDVVANYILLAIVLMEAAGLDSIDKVILEQDARAAFIGVQPPATVRIGMHVVKHIVADNGPF